MNDEDFKKLVGEALDTLPEEFAKKLDNVVVTVDDFPTPYQLKKTGIPPWALLFGLYEGVPKTKRGIYYNSIPDKITIFKNAIERISQTPEEIKANIRQTVVHEIGHHFGLSDAQLK